MNQSLVKESVKPPNKQKQKLKNFLKWMQYIPSGNYLRGSCKKFCRWVRITSVLRFIKHVFISNLQSIPPLLKHIFVTFLPSCKQQKSSLVSDGDTDK